MSANRHTIENFKKVLKQMEPEIIDLARKDQAFHRALVQNPHQALESAFNIKFPAGFNLKILEEKANVLHFVLPNTAEGNSELSDDDLDQVAGGGSGQGHTYSGC